MARKKQSSGESGVGPGRPKKPKPDMSNVTPALMAEALATYMADRADIARLTARCGANLARYEAQGVDPGLVKATAALARYTQAEVAERKKREALFAVAVGVVRAEDLDWSGDQGAFAFATATGDAADRLAGQRALDQGYKAGKKGYSLDSNPYNDRPGSPEFVGWRDGWQDGHEDRLLRNPDADRTTHASARRSRKEPTPADDDGPIDDPRQEAAF